jgi:hypothetical protein
MPKPLKNPVDIRMTFTNLLTAQGVGLFPSNLDASSALTYDPQANAKVLKRSPYMEFAPPFVGISNLPYTGLPLADRYADPTEQTEFAQQYRMLMKIVDGTPKYGYLHDFPSITLVRAKEHPDYVFHQATWAVYNSIGNAWHRMMVANPFPYTSEYYKLAAEGYADKDMVFAAALSAELSAHLVFLTFYDSFRTIQFMSNPEDNHRPIKYEVLTKPYSRVARYWQQTLERDGLTPDVTGIILLQGLSHAITGSDWDRANHFLEFEIKRLEQRGEHKNKLDTLLRRAWIKLQGNAETWSKAEKESASEAIADLRAVTRAWGEGNLRSKEEIAAMEQFTDELERYHEGAETVEPVPPMKLSKECRKSLNLLFPHPSWTS